MLPAIASRARTSLFLAGAAGTIAAAALVSGGRPPSGFECPGATADDGIRLEARTASTQILPGDQNVAITIQVPEAASTARPPLSLAIVIDRSGSMTGEPLANAKAAAARLIARLDGDDAFSLVTYSSRAETQMGIVHADAVYKRAAFAFLDDIFADGGTCISCGLSAGAAELARSPVHDGVSRMVLISDGQANEGIYDRDELAELATTIAAHGTSITSVGVGLDFDEVTMVRLANVGHGNYYFAEDARELDGQFARELGGLADTVAADVRLVLDGDIEEAYGYPIERTGGHVIIPIADLRAGESRKVVVRARVAAGKGPVTVTRVALDWRRVSDGAARHATATACATVTDDARAVAASLDPATAGTIEQALSARSLEQANAVYDRNGVEAAQRILELRDNVMLLPAARERLQADNAAALDNLRSASPAKAKKVNSVMSYQLAR